MSGDVGSSGQLVRVMVAAELERLAAEQDGATGRRLRVLMRMVDRVAWARPGQG